MTSIQTFYDVLFAVVLMVGIAAGLALTFVAAGAMHERQQVKASTTGSPVRPDGQAQPARTEETRELTLR